MLGRAGAPASLCSLASWSAAVSAALAREAAVESVSLEAGLVLNREEDGTELLPLLCLWRALGVRAMTEAEAVVEARGAGGEVRIDGRDLLRVSWLPRLFVR